MKRKSADITSDKYLVDQCLNAYEHLLQVKPYLLTKQIPVLSIKLPSNEDALSCYLTFQTEILKRSKSKGKVAVSLLHNNTIEIREAYESFPLSEHEEWFDMILKRHKDFLNRNAHLAHVK